MTTAADSGIPSSVIRLITSTPIIASLSCGGRTAAVDPHATGPWKQRNEAIERISDVGRRQWCKESGAHRQTGAENVMFRYKRVLGDSLRARKFYTQNREAEIAVNILNRMAEHGTPCSVADER